MSAALVIYQLDDSFTDRYAEVQRAIVNTGFFTATPKLVNGNVLLLPSSVVLCRKQVTEQSNREIADFNLWVRQFLAAVQVPVVQLLTPIVSRFGGYDSYGSQGEVAMPSSLSSTDDSQVRMADGLELDWDDLHDLSDSDAPFPW